MLLLVLTVPLPLLNQQVHPYLHGEQVSLFISAPFYFELF
uniref:Uncharacterized protein n=1 Tax=Picea sitchensis TaxID=3332 RepID=A0A6B9XWT0_PICSI|nr:hypothetical protein Q903MT_gene4100 [Picea sitchensis]